MSQRGMRPTLPASSLAGEVGALEPVVQLPWEAVRRVRDGEARVGSGGEGGGDLVHDEDGAGVEVGEAFEGVGEEVEVF